MLRFVIVWLASVVALMMAAFVLDTFASVDVRTGTNIVTAIIPGLYVGQLNAQKTQMAMDGGRMWRLSIVGNVIVGCASVLLLYLPFSMADESLRGVIAVLSPAGFLAIVALVFGVYVLTTRFFMGFGQRLALKQIEKQRS